MSIDWNQPATQLELLEVIAPNREQIARQPWPPFRLIMSWKLTWHEQQVLQEFFLAAQVVPGDEVPTVYWMVSAHELSKNAKRLTKRVEKLERRGRKFAEKQREKIASFESAAETANRAIGRRQRRWFSWFSWFSRVRGAEAATPETPGPP